MEALTDEERREERTPQPPGTPLREGDAPFQLVFPGAGEEPVGEEELRSLSAALQEVREAESLDGERLQTLRAIAVAQGEVVGRQPTPEPGETGIRVEGGEPVTISAEGECRAGRYGYLCLQGDRLSIVSPLWMDPEAMQVYWLLLDEKPQPVTVNMVRQCLADLGVVEGIQEPEIAKKVAQVRQGRHACGAFLIAVGTAPREGQDAQVEILVDIQPLAGKEREDGSLDFREVNFAPNAPAGQPVARRRPPVRGTPGRNVKGDVVAVMDVKEPILEAGDNVRVEYQDGVELFLATTTGLLAQNAQEISVSRLLHINGDVDFNTGNLDFDGEISIQGSVIQGFSVKATSNITITGTVESGATVMAGRNLTVGRGILGRKTRVTARDTVRAQFVQEARVAAGRDIVLGNFAYQARLHAGRQVNVTRGKGQGRGSVVGGQTWAHVRIEMLMAGSSDHVQTLLMAGVDANKLQRLDQLREGIDLIYFRLRHLLAQFGMKTVDVGQIKNMIAGTTGPRRMLLASKAQKLGQTVKDYQKLVATCDQLEQQMAAQVQGAEIRVHEQAFPRVEIRLGEHQRQLEEELASPCFRVVDGELVERLDPMALRR